MKLALAIIAKDEVDQLNRIIKDYSQYFDEIAIALDADVELETNDKVKVHRYEWCNDFSHKRNWLADRIESEYYFRLDTDDVIHNPSQIQPLFKDVVAHGKDIIYLQYLYSKDKDNNCVAKHWRETIVKKSDNLSWKGTVHESVVVEDTDNFHGVKDDRIIILHETDEDHHKASFRRNFEILKAEYNRDKENTDPRTIAYLGRMLLGANSYDKAKNLLELFLTKSGWEEDKYFAYCELSQCWVRLKDYERAIACCQEAMNLNVDYPDAYLALSEIYNEKGDHHKAIHWGKVGMSKSEPNTLVVVDPTKYTYRAYMNMAIAYFHIGDYVKAKSFYDKSANIAPNEDIVKNNRELFYEAADNDKFVKDFVSCVMYAEKHDPSKCQGLVSSIPKNMLKDERMHHVRNRYLPPQAWHDKSVVIYCGPAWEEWAAPSVIKGIGGSEEAVIYLSKELASLGWEVTVFNECGEYAGLYQGVRYRNFHEFNPNDEFNVIVSWRANMFNAPIKAKKKIVWLHDVPIGQLGKGEEKTFDKVIVLSQYHKSLLPDHIPEEKIFVSKNGINTDDFKNNGVERNPLRMIHTSSYDRGIQHLLKMWPDVRKEVPDAELHLFYGWNTYDSMVEKGVRNVNFKNVMVRAMNQPGIFEHGRVGHKRLIQEFQKSSLYVYPAHFSEISCISAMKAQECGCIPVTTNYAALEETVKEGIKVPGQCGDKSVDEVYKKELISILKDEVRQENLRVKVLMNKGKFGWDQVAREWSEELFSKNIRARDYKSVDEYKEQYSGYHLRDKDRSPFVAGNIENDIPYLRPRFKFILDACEQRNIKSVFDVGFSDGSLLYFLADKGIDVSGIEVDERAKVYVEDYCNRHGFKGDFHVGIFEEFTTDRKYDLVVACEVIEHVVNPEEFIRKMNSLSNKYVFLSTPHKDGPYGEINVDPLHLRYYDDESLQKLIGEKNIVFSKEDGGLMHYLYEV